ncbi:DUF5995 family protein [Solirubrobacter ginsenosidimutans]|uniref:DUF5995 family protein n=1 Tax=Solirubrobacter ginsenosidimutans TaxID=490573 RepID=A0A9X3S436_9ACTN|nr:DUF5995 family protein [Solirubrobacter ginsenosidimutans]MDA0164042.1 DUF5995 family protein [Solirubrobacter ginsenosidimutans]
MQDLAGQIHGLERTRTFADVISSLLEIERARDGYANPARNALRRRVRRAPDGVACFNFMYLRVTQAVNSRLATFEDPAFVERLGVVFAEFYLREYAANEAKAWVSKAWEPLFSEGRRKDVAPVQFALAGMNAHINNDLPWALLQAWREAGGAPADDSPVYRDFQLVNRILQDVAVEVRATLESGLIRWLDRLFGRFDDVVATFVVAKARTEAWQRAERWDRRFDEETAEAHERHVGYESRLVLAA